LRDLRACCDFSLPRFLSKTKQMRNKSATLNKHQMLSERSSPWQMPVARDVNYHSKKKEDLCA